MQKLNLKQNKKFVCLEKKINVIKRNFLPFFIILIVANTNLSIFVSDNSLGGIKSVLIIILNTVYVMKTKVVSLKCQESR